MTDDVDIAGPLPDGPVVCGVDGSANGRRALGVARQLGAALGVEVVAVHALGLMAEIDGEHVPAADHRDEIERRLRSVWCEPLAAAEDVRWTCRLVDGPPADVLVHAAEETGAAFVVVGARGIGGDPDLVLGSTSHHVVHRARCATVVVPPVERSSH